MKNKVNELVEQLRMTGILTPAGIDVVGIVILHMIRMHALLSEKRDAIMKFAEYGRCYKSYGPQNELNLD